MNADKSVFEENRDAGKAIAEVGGSEVVGLVMGIMARDAEAAYDLERSLYEGLERDRDRWKERAERAEAELQILLDRQIRSMYVSDEEIDRRLAGGRGSM